MKLSDEAINIISCACYPAHMQAAEDFIAKLEAELAKWTDGRKLVKYVEGLEAKLEAITCGRCEKNMLECGCDD